MNMQSNVTVVGASNSAFKELRSDLKEAATDLTVNEVRFLVKTYYEFQKYRIVSNNRIKAVEKKDTRPVACLSYFTDHFMELEKSMITPLKAYVENDPVGQWLISQKGIGPVIAAGFLSFLDITRAPSAAHFISFAGFDPSLEWDKKADQWKRVYSKYNPETKSRDVIGEKLLGRKRPYNTELKTLCFKFSKSIVMSGKGEFYRQLFDTRKAEEIRRNLSGDYMSRALAILERVNKGNMQDIHNDEDDEEKSEEEKAKAISSYKATLAKGQLIPAHIDARARRHVSTIFLNHIFTVMYEEHYKMKAPAPYAFAHLGHVDYLAPPKYISPYA